MPAISNTVALYNNIAARVEKLAKKIAKKPEDMKELLDEALTDIQVEISTKRTKNGRKKKDPSLPKKGKSSYLLFCDDRRAVISEKVAEKMKGRSAKEIFNAKTKALSAAWKALLPEEKKVYTDKANEGKPPKEKMENKPSTRAIDMGTKVDIFNALKLLPPVKFGLIEGKVKEEEYSKFVEEIKEEEKMEIVISTPKAAGTYVVLRTMRCKGKRSLFYVSRGASYKKYMMVYSEVCDFFNKMKVASWKIEKWANDEEKVKRKSRNL